MFDCLLDLCPCTVMRCCLFFAFLLYGTWAKMTRSRRSYIQTRDRIGSVVECLTRERGAVGSSLTGVTA